MNKLSKEQRDIIVALLMMGVGAFCLAAIIMVVRG